MQAQALAWRRAGETIVFVPTMGALHAGHAALLQAGRPRGSKLVLSIFVNPTQFAPSEDFAQYPRPLEADLALARRCEVDAVFLPSTEAIYPPQYQTAIEVEAMTRGLCGAQRPGHFRGVTTIVCKLFHLVQPHIALFGEKDYQQLQVIKCMVRDLGMPIEILGVPTVRESDGLALSSRNHYLSPTERQQALAISRALFAAERAAEPDPAVLIAGVRATLQTAGIDAIDYIEIVDADTLMPLTQLDRPARLCIAVRVGKTRLIDNIALPTPG